MNDTKKAELSGKFAHAMQNGRRWLKQGIVIIIALAVAVVAVWAAFVQYKDNVTTQGKNEELTTQLADATKKQEAVSAELESTQEKLKKTEEDLSYANNQVELLTETTAALNNQVSNLEKEKSKLEKRIKELLVIKPSKPKITRAQLEEQISSIGELATLKYIYTNSSRKEGNLTWLWGWALPFSDSSLLVTYDGTIKAGINLSEIKFDVNENSRIITVTLPKSRVLDNYIPQETINVLEVKNGLFNTVTFDDYNKFISQEKKVMEEKAVDMGLLKDADKEAKATVEAFLKGIPGMDTYTLVIK